LIDEQLRPRHHLLKKLPHQDSRSKRSPLLLVSFLVSIAALKQIAYNVSSQLSTTAQRDKTIPLKIQP
jgi:hypothetical protein